MAPTSTTSNNGLILDSHEDRLQKVEVHVQDISLKVAEIGLKQDYNQHILEQFQSDLSNRLDNWSQELRQTVAGCTASIKAVEDLNQRQEARIAPLEAHHLAQVKTVKVRKDTVKKLVIGALLAAAGVVGTKGVEILFAAVDR